MLLFFLLYYIRVIRFRLIVQLCESMALYHRASLRASTHVKYDWFCLSAALNLLSKTLSKRYFSDNWDHFDLDRTYSCISICLNEQVMQGEPLIWPLRVRTYNIKMHTLVSFRAKCTQPPIKPYTTGVYFI